MEEAAQLSPLGREWAKQAEAAADLFEQHEAAGRRGDPCPSEPPIAVQGWKAGDARRRILAGEALGFISQGTRCKACGDHNFGWRAGCRCNTDWNQGTVEWGFFIEDRECAGSGESRFKLHAEVLALGLPVIDAFTGEVMPVEPAR